MIVILKRGDLKVEGLPAEQIRLHHTLLPREIIETAELIVFTEDNRVFLLYAKNWPMKKPMSPAELFRYIAKHAAIESDNSRQPGRLA